MDPETFSVAGRFRLTQVHAAWILELQITGTVKFSTKDSSPLCKGSV